MTIHAEVVSVIIPCYNAEKFLAATLDSVLAQTYRPLEIIVVNDGSTDRSAEIAQRYALHGVKVFSKENEGLTRTRNYGFLRSTGNYIQTLDADDLLSPDKIERQMELLLQPGNEQKIAFSSWGRFSLDDLSDFTEVKDQKKHFKSGHPADILCDMWTNYWYLPNHSWLFPRTVLEKSGLWDPAITFNEDWELATRAICSSRGVIYATSGFAGYRRTPNSMSAAPVSKKVNDDILYATRSRTRTLLALEESEQSRQAAAELYYTWAWMLNIYGNCNLHLGECLKELETLGWPRPVQAGGRYCPVIKMFGFRNALRIKRLHERIMKLKSFWR